MKTDWEHSLRCPHCGGLNDLDAEWCMQCSERLKPVSSPIDMTAGAPGLPELALGGLDVIAGDPNEHADAAISQAFAVEGRGVTWTCARCFHRNDIKASACAGCGRSFAESARLIADAEVPKKQSRATMKALGIVGSGALVMRLVAGFVSPWIVAAAFGGMLLRGVIRFLRD
jgi:ribosomal protein L40E